MKLNFRKKINNYHKIIEADLWGSMKKQKIRDGPKTIVKQCGFSDAMGQPLYSLILQYNKNVAKMNRNVLNLLAY